MRNFLVEGRDLIKTFGIGTATGRVASNRERFDINQPKIAAVAREAKETHVIYNNCFSNYGTTNAHEAARLLQELQST